MPGKINPYIAGAPVLESRMFFGREDVFSWIERSLSGKFVDHILVIHGQRRVGKTSVLKHLSNRLPERYIPIFIDLQGRVSTTLPRFLWWLSREITRALDLPKPDRELFEEDPDYFETQFLPQVEEKLGSDVLLFTFDEFDTLETTSAQEGLALPFMAILKRLMDHRKLNFIFSIGSSGRKLENMQAAYTGFFKQALYRKISFLSESDARDLVTKPVEGVVQFELDAVDRIYEITSGHPYFIQLICHELFSVCQKINKWQVSKSDVEDILDAVIERGTVNLKFVWDEASELEKWVLASLAQFDSGADLGTLGKFLKSQKVRFIHQDLESAVLRLREKDVLASGNRFVIFLMKLWLIQNRSIEQVREELTAVNPIVSRLLQVGHEYLDQGELEKAVDSFEEALGAEEDNLEVRMGLASAHMAREDYGRAGAEYEEVLALYPEDVAAQSGYCDAYLALGDVRFAMGRLDEAEYAYQQVLKISPKHSDGRGHMARLYHHRAVAAISGGEDIALEQARKALEFTPRDPGLQASVKELETLADGTGEIRSVLLSWGQRSRQNEHWKDAADLFSAYQRLKGADESVLSLLSDIREKAHTEQLSSLRAQAERMERLGEYDEAIFALNQYLSLAPQDADQVPERIKQLKEARKQAAQLREGRTDAKPFWKQPIAWVGFAVVAALSALLLIPDSPLRTALAPEQEVVEKIVVATPKPTTMPTPTPEPLPYQWSRINSAQFLQRDQITALVIHPTDPDIIYAGMYKSGIYKTIDGGISWFPIQQGLTRGWIDNLIIDPQDPDTLYAGVILAGVYKTEDGGENWHQLNINLDYYWHNTSHVFMDPAESTHLVYTSGWHIAESFDAGETWKVTGLGEMGISVPGVISSISVDPETGNLLLAVFSYENQQSYIYISKDYGVSWKPAIENMGICGDNLNYDPSRNIFIYTGCKRFYLSSDGGEIWEKISTTHCRNCFISSDGIYYSGDLRFSEDGGHTWKQSNTPYEVDHDNAVVVVSPSNPNRIVVGGGELFASSDNGISWEKRESGLGAANTSIGFGKSVDTIYFGQYQKRHSIFYEEFLGFNLVDQSLDQLSNKDCDSNLDEDWEIALCRISNKFEGKADPEEDPTGSFQAVFFHPTWPEYVYGIYGPMLYHSQDGGNTFFSCDLKGGWLSEKKSAVALDPEDPNTVIMAGGGGLFISRDNCENFTKVMEVDTDYINSVVFNPKDPRWIYAATDAGVYLSSDGGENWGQINDGLLGALTVYELAIDPRNTNDIYAISAYGLFKLEEK